MNPIPSSGSLSAAWIAPSWAWTSSGDTTSGPHSTLPGGGEGMVVSEGPHEVLCKPLQEVTLLKEE